VRKLLNSAHPKKGRINETILADPA